MFYVLNPSKLGQFVTPRPALRPVWLEQSLEKNICDDVSMIVGVILFLEHCNSVCFAVWNEGKCNLILKYHSVVVEEWKRRD